MSDNDKAEKSAETSSESGSHSTPARSGESQPENSGRVVLLVKGEMLAAITLIHTPQHNIVASRDPRCAAPSMRSFADPKHARAIFLRTVCTSCEHGWRLFYAGPPLNG